MPLAALPKEDTREPEAAKDMAGELSRRRRSPLPDGPAVARLSASGLLPAAGGPFGFGVEVVLPFFMMLSSVSPKINSPAKESDLMKYRSLPPLILWQLLPAYEAGYHGRPPTVLALLAGPSWHC